jgi:uncharacterized protein with HEPN domain
MSQIRDDAWLLDIINAIRFVTEYAASVSEDTFSVDHATQNVIIREVTIIGEAVRRLSLDLLKRILKFHSVRSLQ